MEQEKMKLADKLKMIAMPVAATVVTIGGFIVIDQVTKRYIPPVNGLAQKICVKAAILTASSLAVSKIADTAASEAEQACDTLGTVVDVLQGNYILEEDKSYE